MPGKEGSRVRKLVSMVLIVVLLAAVAFFGVSLVRREAKEEMYPGLDLQSLHNSGIDGAGVSVAIIDQKLLVSHEEYAANLVHYEEQKPLDHEPNSMHGPAVSSILVGKNCGVAPGANLYYWAVPVHGDEPGGVRYAQAVRSIIEFNESLPKERQIRVLSISTGFSGDDGGDDFLSAVREAWDSGIIVLTSSFPYFTDPVIAVYGAALKRGGSRDRADDYIVQPLVVEHTGRSAEEIARLRNQQGDGQTSYAPVWVPVEPRVLASSKGDGKYERFDEGGDSWATPYVAGVAALILQVNPELSNREVIQIIADTTVENANGLKMIWPQQAVERARGEAD